MKAFAITNPGQSEIQEIKKPEPQEGEALLRIHKVGFCGGDLNAFRGTFPMQQYPMIIGHEVGATIEAIGTGVPEDFGAGTRVTLNPYQAGADDLDDCLPCRLEVEPTLARHRPSTMLALSPLSLCWTPSRTQQPP